MSIVLGILTGICTGGVYSATGDGCLALAVAAGLAAVVCAIHFPGKP